MVPKLVVPSTAADGTEFSAISVVDGSIFQIIQCTHVPIGASGSSEINTRLTAFAGTPEISSGGLMFSPSHVYLAGIVSPVKAGLFMFMVIEVIEPGTDYEHPVKIIP